MKRRDASVEDIHKLLERTGRAYDRDVDRIGATIRRHEGDAGRSPADVAPREQPGSGRFFNGAARRRDGAVDA